MGHGKVIEKDHGLEALKKRLRNIQRSGSYVKVGVMGKNGDAAHGEVTNAELAIMAEFGTSKQPARPFISATFEKHKDEYHSMIRKGVEKIYANETTVEKVLGLVGVKMASDVKQFVTSRDNNLTPNALSTMERKLKKTPKGKTMIGPVESPRPLVDTGRMVGSVTHEVVVTGDEVPKGYTAPTAASHEFGLLDALLSGKSSPFEGGGHG